jgi:flavin-binding protein dodecin
MSEGGLGGADTPPIQAEEEANMSESVYKVIELVGTSPTSWEDAARNAVETAGKSLKDLRIAEIGKLDLRVEDGRVTAYRARVNLSFKYFSE